MSARNVFRRFVAALKAGEQADLASGDTMEFLPAVDDQGAVNFGDGTTDMDVKIFLGSTTASVEFDVGNSRVNATVPFTGGGPANFSAVVIAAQQTLAAGGGAVTVTEFYTAGASDSGGDAWTLADGVFKGQLKKVQLITDGGGDATLTPSNLTGGTTITFADAGDFVLLCWDGSGWVALELGNGADGVTAPVLA